MPNGNGIAALSCTTGCIVRGWFGLVLLSFACGAFVGICSVINPANSRVHYNLPAEQQEAVQRYLNIRSYPSYRLIGKDGQIYPLDWRHADNMDAFRRTVEATDK